MEQYLSELPEPVIARLFRSPASCLALLRLLPPLARAIVLRMLFAAAPLPRTSLEHFVARPHRRAQVDALQKLRSLKIVREKVAKQELTLNAEFQQSLRTALTSGAANEGIAEAGPQLRMEVLRDYHKQRWENMLLFMVSSAGALGVASERNKQITSTFLALLVKSGLLNRQHLITSKGFQFLLQPAQTQVWSLLLHYLHNAAELNMDPTNVLGFIFRLAALELGRGHALSGVPPEYRRVLDELAELGIVKVENDVFYAAVDLTAPAEQAAEVGAASQNGFIIVETNYRLYAYTSSPLQIAILNLFCSLKARFANLVIGRLTRNSSRRAMANGIHADQIVQYLQSNIKGGGPLPQTISDQIKLWQLELDRFKHAPGFLFRDFDSAKQFAAARQFAEDIGALLWANDRTRTFFVEERSMRDVADFVAREVK